MADVVAKIDDPEIIRKVNANNMNDVKTLLLTGEAKVDELDGNGMTPLQHAAYKGNADMCRLLLQQGANVNLDHHDHNYSALHFAALSGNAECVQLLLAAGARPYHTNSLGRTASQMAGFVGNHAVVVLINTYLPLSEVLYFTKLQGLETEPKLPLESAQPLYDLIVQMNLHPVRIALLVERCKALVNNLGKVRRVLELMCEKENNKPENVNEVMCMKFHYLSFIVKTLESEFNLLKDTTKERQEKVDVCRDELMFESLLKLWLKGRPRDGYQEHLEWLVRDAVRAFPYPEMPIFVQLLRTLTTSHSEDSWALGALASMVNGQRPFGQEDAVENCGACEQEKCGGKKCAKCHSVTYCDKVCQRLHWGTHKKVCQKKEGSVVPKVSVQDEERSQAENKEETLGDDGKQEE